MKSVEVVKDPAGLEAAWSKQYDKLAQIFADILGSKRQRVAEIGCGRGQFTIPLARRARNLRFVLVDRFVGTNYSKNYNALLHDLKTAGFARRAQIVVSDYMNWIRSQKDDTYDAVVSSEFLPELDSEGTHRFIGGCYRVLKPRTVTIHAFLSPTPRNPRQGLLIRADSNPLWTNTPPKEWFSPKPALVVRELKKFGFHQIRKNTIRTHLIMKADAAKSWLTSAEVKASFFERYGRVLCSSGLEAPDWIIISAIK